MSGYKLTFQVLFHGAPAFSAMSQSVMGILWGSSADNSGGVGWLSGQPLDTWLPMSYTFTNSSELMDHLGIFFMSASTQWNGTMYIDDVQISPP